MKHIFKKLPNGIPVLLVPQKETNLFTLFVLVRAGSRNEEVKNNGISHFIEHLLFKGSSKRPNYLEISKSLDELGGEYNAFTAKDLTGYYVKTDIKHVNQAIDILADLVLRPLFVPAEVNQERGVIIEEMNMYEDNPMLHIETLLEEIIFSSHPLAQPIIGSRRVIRNISRQSIVDYHQKYYQVNNLLLGVAGKINQAKVIKQLAKKFIAESAGRPVRRDQKFSNRQKQARIRIDYRKTQQVHTAIGWPTFRRSDKRNYALMVLAIILGGNMSSRLFVELREKRGLAYYVKSYVEQYSDTGALIIQAGLEKNNIFLALQIIKKQLRDITSGGLSLDELKRAKNFLQGYLNVKMENSATLVQWLAKQQLLEGNLIDLNRYNQQISKVTARQVQQVAKTIFLKKLTNLAVIGPYKKQAEFRKYL